jgi:hypothetical protein
MKKLLHLEIENCNECPNMHWDNEELDYFCFETGKSIPGMLDKPIPESCPLENLL